MSECDLSSYLERMRNYLAARGRDFRAIIPDVDGGLLLVPGKRARDRITKLTLLPGDDVLPRVETSSPGNGELIEMVVEFLRGNTHSLLEFRGREMKQVVIDRQVPLQRVWQEHLVAGKVLWGRMRLERLEKTPGAIYLTFTACRAGGDTKTPDGDEHDSPGKVVLRVCDEADPRLSGSRPFLRINRLVVELLQDKRRQPPPLAEQVERFLAFLLAHTTGVDTRLVPARKRVPDVGLHGPELAVNPFIAQARQGAAGMLANLAGFPRKRLRVLSVGDSSCRQTFPPFCRLPFFADWSYFPVRTVPRPGEWRAIDFGEKDLIGGIEGRLAQVVDEIVEENPDCLIAVVQTCVSRLIGDDIDGVLNERLGPGRWVLLDPDFQSRKGAVDSVLWGWLLDVFPRKTKINTGDSPMASGDSGRKTAPEESVLVNLVGFGHPPEPQAVEIAELLEELGIKVNCWLFPSFREEELARFHDASLTIAADCMLIRNAFSNMPGNWHLLPPPFGLAGTSSWLNRVAGLVFDEQTCAEVKKKTAVLAGNYQEKMKTHLARLNGCSLAVMASSSLCSFVFNPRELFGIPLLEITKELKLGLEVFLLEDQPPPKEIVEIAESGEISLHMSRGAHTLLKQLETSPATFLLSSLPRNTIALAQGKFPLRARHFCMGYKGMLETSALLNSVLESELTKKLKGWVNP